MLSEKIISCYYSTMERILVLLALYCFLQGSVYAEETVSSNVLKMSDVVVFQDDGLFGLKDKKDNIVVNAQYKKLIRVGNSSWIIQKRNRFGLIDTNGNFLVQPKYRHVERVFGKYVKLGNENDFGLHDEFGNVVISHEYSMIEPLFGGKFLTCRGYKYGILDDDGKVLLGNEFDDIYMPNPQTLRVSYEGEWYEITKWTDDYIELPPDVQKIKIADDDFKVTHLAVNTGLMSGYTAITVTDYALKLVSSLSPAYEQTIDELMLSQGAETVSIFVKFGWIPKFPFTYAKKYYQNVRNPNTGLFSGVRKNIKRQFK